jgi:membrane-bound lytic murein transglycosylase D
MPAPAEEASPTARIVPLEPMLPPDAATSSAAGDDPASAARRSLIALDDETARADLWVRVRNGFAMPDINTEHVRKWEQWYATRPDYVQRMTERGGRYLFHIVEEVQRRGMPAELALLPFIESAFNPQAVSSARAAGMWQFMPLTGKDFELKQNLFRDDRRDVLASTRAALDYLQKLHGLFGDWHLALAAYNWGQGNVQRAILRNQRAGLPIGYLDLSMPDETRNYVPKLQAVKNIVARPADFSIVLPRLENHPFFLSVQIERDIDVALAARLAGMSLEAFQELNPQMNKPVILAAGTPQVLLPYDNANAFLRQLETHRGPLATWTAWVAPTTLKPADAARLVGMPEDRLREVNRIPPRMLVKAGSTLLVLRPPQATNDVAEHIADNATMSLAPESPPLQRVSFKVGKKGDSVAAVARRYRVSASQVAGWNSVTTSAKFKPGQTVVVMLAKKPPRAAAKGTSTARSRAERPAAPARASATRR